MRATRVGPDPALWRSRQDIKVSRNHLLISKAMTASTFEFASRAARMPRRRSKDRRTLGRLRELCDEVLASYRLAQGEDIVTPEDRDIAKQVLRGIAPLNG